MKTKKIIKLIYPFKFQLQLSISNQSLSSTSFIDHLKRYGILPIGDKEQIQQVILNYDVYKYKQINPDTKQQLVKVDNIGQFDLYYVVEDGNQSAILKFCHNQLGQEEENEDLNQYQIQNENNQEQVQNQNNQESEEVETKNNIIQSKSILNLQQSISDRDHIYTWNELGRKPIIKKAQKLIDINQKDIINDNPEDQISVTGKKKIITNLKLNKKTIKLSQIRKIYSKNNERQQYKEQHERNEKLQNQYETEKISIKFSLNNKIIESLQVKKMQKVRSQILKDYQIFYDEKLSKPIKNKDFIIAINSRVLYCKEITTNHKEHFKRSKNLPIYKRIKQNQQILQKQQELQQLHQQKPIHQFEQSISNIPGNNSNNISKQDSPSSIFRIHKRKNNIFSNNTIPIQNRQQSHQDHINLNPLIHKLTLQPKPIQQQQSTMLQKNKSKIILRTNRNKTIPKISKKIENEQLQQFLNEQIIPEQYNAPQTKRNTVSLVK